jgi:tetratricopeptide (TPR) repeat protein
VHRIVVQMLLACVSLASVKAATIAGVVRDTQGNPIEGAQIKAVCEQSPETVAQVISGKGGAYRFAELLPCRYQLSVTRSGFGVASPAVVTVPTPSSSAVADVTLSAPPQQNNATASQPQLKFEAAGIRGLIDPGGYSAPANAAAASGLISGIADIRRTENGAESPTARDLPCTLESELTKTAAQSPQDANASRRIGEFYLVHGSASRAIPYFERARKIDRTDVRTVKDLSESLLMTGQFNSARELLATLPAGQRDVGFYRLLARAEEGSGDFTQASEHYRIAADKDHSEENIFGAGYELILAGRPADAAKIFQEGVTRYPLSVTLLIGAGTANFLQGNSSAAVDLFLQATNLKPSDPRSYAFLARSFEVSGAHGEQVRASLKRHLELSPTDAEAYYFYAVGLLHGNANGEAADYGKAESLLKQAIGLDPNLAKAHFQLGWLYVLRENYESATREFEATERLAPDMKDVHYRLAATYRRTGRTEAAEREMKLFLEAREPIKEENERGGISIEQFISVVDRPGHPATKELQCSNPPVE